MHYLPGVLILLSGIVGALMSERDMRAAAWILLAIAGLFMVLPL